MCPCTWFGAFRPSFPNMHQYLSNCETGIIRPTEGIDTSIRSHLMWNKELKTLDFFLCNSVLDLGVFGPFSHEITLMPIYPKNRYNSIVRWPWQEWNLIWCEMWSRRLWITLDMFLHMTWVTWVQFSQIYLMSKYPIAAITWPTDSLYTRSRSDWT